MGEVLLHCESGGGAERDVFCLRAQTDLELGPVGTMGKCSAVCWRVWRKENVVHFRGRVPEYSTEYDCRPKSPVTSTWSPLT